MMKGNDHLHIFCIHSSTTFIVANGVVDKLKIKKENVLFLKMREFATTTEFSATTLSPFKIDHVLNVLNTRKQVREFDQQVLQITEGGGFEIYLPHQLNGSFYMLSTNSNCLKYHFIEEGLASYVDYNIVNQVYESDYKSIFHKVVFSILNRLNFGTRSSGLGQIYNCENSKYGSAFGMFKECFPNFPNRKLITAEYEIEQLSQLSEIKQLIVFGAEVENNYVNLEKFKILLTSFLSCYQQVFKTETLYFKFHPSQSKLVKTEILNLINTSDIVTQELNSTASLESIAFHFDVKLYQLISTSGFYAALMGRQVFSLSNMIALSQSLQEKIDVFPAKYFELIKHPKTMDELKAHLLLDQAKIKVQS